MFSDESDKAAFRQGLTSLIRPKSVVVLGASAKRVSGGTEALRNLLASGYPTDQVHVVHPEGSRIEEIQSVASVSELPEGIDAALLSVPARTLAKTAEALVVQGCKSILVASAGLDHHTKSTLRTLSQGSGVPIHGPNCMGLLNFTDSIPLWFYEGLLTRGEPGDTGLISQSGSATFIFRAAERTRFSKIMSTGNELAVTTADYLDWFADDPATARVGIVIESIPDVSAFVRAVARMRDAGKQVVALKVGRTALGQQATAAHTSALIGHDEAYQALFDDLDVPLVLDYDEMAVTLDALSDAAFVRPAGPRIAVITDSGGQAGLAADIAGRSGIALAEFSESTTAQLQSILGVSTINNPFDAGSSTIAGVDEYVAAFETVARAPEVDSVMIIAEGHITLSDHEVSKPGYYNAAIRAAGDAAHGRIPVVLATSSSASTHPLIAELIGPHVTALRGIPNALRALTAATRNQLPVVVTTSRPGDIPSTDRVAELRARVSAGAGESVDSVTVALLLQEYGLNYVSSLHTSDPDAAAAWAEGRYPLVVKSSTAEIAHRSDIGGVVVGIKDEQHLRAALTQVRDNVCKVLGAQAEVVFELQPMVSGVEAMLGFVSDPIFGAMVTVGTGGTAVELHADVATSRAPVSSDEADRRVRQTRLGRLISGYRNLYPVTDTGGLAEAMSRLSWLAFDMKGLITGVDLNPVFVEPVTGRVQLVDALFLTTQAEPLAT